MKNDKTDSKCEILEEQAFSNRASAMKEWEKHAESCPECKVKIQMINDISDSIDKLDLTMGKKRIAILDAALKKERETSKFQFLYKYAAAAAVVLVCFIVIDFMQNSGVENPGITKTDPVNSNLVQEKTDEELAWNHKFDKRKATLRVARLNRLRNESRRENGYLDRLKKRCRKTKSRINRLKDKQEFM